MNLRQLATLSILGLTSGLSAASLDEARALFAAKKAPEAREMLEKLCADSPQDAELRFHLGRCQIALQQWDDGIISLEKAMQLAPQRMDIKAEYGISCLNLAGAKTSLSYAKKGRNTLEEVLKVEPTNLPAHEGLAAFYSNAPWIVGGDMAKAAEHAEAIRKQNPRRGLALLVGMKNRDKKYDESFALCEDSLKLKGDDYTALYEFGRTASVSGKRKEDGLRALERCLALEAPKGSPGHAGVHYRMALICRDSGDREGAKRHIEEGLKLSPEDKQLKEALKNLGV